MSDKRALIEDALADVLLDVLQNGKSVVDQEGNVIRLTPDAAYLQAARAFLKDFPPDTMPTMTSSKGVLKDYMERIGAGNA